MYLVYDEKDKETIYLDFFKGLNRMMFEELNEYTIAISRVILNFTEMEIWCTDERILWFVDADPRLHIEKELPENRFDDDSFYIQEQLRVGMEDNNFNRLSNTYAFHNITNIFVNLPKEPAFDTYSLKEDLEDEIKSVE